ncbi:exodeoxyribonuclease VII small subunit [Campylobacter fetus]|uniref:Exodeoxyribonuclease VII small subunit n=1 Tax=Campylobacter fetus subsp. testudinum TaxID=1507806 RepID=A0AAX0H9Q0_CAMFE|nr:exodeoxyribonuclease VII small subunit [Campylobacter fetus]AGZ81486.1 exodeoxyribonuclease VII, small subunit [Campylobacter fetus subsp. testudinum 03-427]AJB45233.1 30S ribosomal protein S17 [Campylobacter fetus subsp. testudinum]ALV64585.1 exodeoxyribonuclease VII, small subunit [Campylobacter fetus subsp. testudinum Sp3]AVK80903.1 exodeoxyribonuclease VII small subunit [Campylobacter fetus subsp. testudinum]EAI4322620.1 exodeoxyribonuclease VII small subunit [Campylobacter fetus]
MQIENESFESKIEKLNELLNKLNDENLTLLDSVELYKSGTKLVKEAREMLENAKLSIQEMSDNNG